MSAVTLSPAAPAIPTPADRDRYLDLLRALAIGVVVLGHWLLAVVWSADGRLQAASLLSESAVARGLTWILQVMPVFFLVGGAVNAQSWRSAAARGDGYGTWLRARAARLLRPTVPLVWAWAVGAPLLLRADLEPGLVRIGAGNALLPLWFLAVYLLVMAAVPPLLALHNRFGLGLVAGLAVLAAVLDQVGGPIAQVNFLVAWSAPLALGFCWADGLLEGRAVRRLLPLAGLALLVPAVAMFGYPASMVGVPGALRSNTSPPTVALVFLGWLQAGAVLAAREPVTRWLRRPRVWSVVVRLNLVAMTVYLWHLTVMVVSVVLLHAVGLLPDSPGLGLGFWATRPLWLAGLAVGLAPVVALLARVELTTPRPRGGRGGAPAVAAPAAASAALCALLVLGAAGSATGLALASVLTGSAVVLGAFRPRHA